MKISFSKTKITPTEPSYLCGYNQNGMKCNEILDDLYIHMLKIEDQETQYIFACLDLLMLDQELVHQFQNVFTAYGIHPENIILSATCTHNGVEYAPHGIFGNQSYGASETYRNFLVEQMRKGFLACNDHIEVECYYAEKEIEGCFGNRNDFNACCDKKMHFIQFEHRGEPVYLLANLGCYPTVLGRDYHKISADLFGALRENLEKMIHVPVMIINGAQGNVSTRFYRQGRDEKELYRAATEITNQLKELEFEPIADHPVKIKDISYAIQSERIKKGLEGKIKQIQEIKHEVKSEMELEQINMSLEILHSYQKDLKDEMVEIKARLIQLGDVYIVTVGGALFTQFSLQIKQAFSQEKVLIWGLTDANVGYLVSKDAYDHCSETLLTRFSKGMAEEFVEHIIGEFAEFIKKGV